MNKIWIPAHEAKLLDEILEDWKQESKHIDWAMKAFIQYKLEKGDYDNLDPFEVTRLKILASYESK